MHVVCAERAARIPFNRRRTIAIQFVAVESKNRRKNVASRIAGIIIIQIQFTSTFELTSELWATQNSEWGLFMRKRIAAIHLHSCMVFVLRAFVRIPQWS